MNELKIVIIEDEVPAARLLQSMVKELRPLWQVTVLPGSVEESVAWFAVNPHPDIIFLDIQLADGNSFDFLSQAKPSSIIIFTTAYDEYAIRAFSVNSIDYILKPVDELRLLEAIRKYESVSGRAVELQPTGYLDIILDSLQNRTKRYRTRFLISGASKLRTLQVSDIAYFYSENRLTFAVTTSGVEYTIDMPLSKLYDELDPDQFFRANRQTLLCVNSITSVEPYFSGKLIVTVKPLHKNKILISEDKIGVFKIWLNY